MPRLGPSVVSPCVCRPPKSICDESRNADKNDSAMRMTPFSASRCRCQAVDPKRAVDSWAFPKRGKKEQRATHRSGETIRCPSTPKRPCRAGRKGDAKNTRRSARYSVWPAPCTAAERGPPVNVPWLFGLRRIDSQRGRRRGWHGRGHLRLAGKRCCGRCPVFCLRSHRNFRYPREIPNRLVWGRVPRIIEHVSVVVGCAVVRPVKRRVAIHVAVVARITAVSRSVTRLRHGPPLIADIFVHRMPAVDSASARIASLAGDIAGIAGHGDRVFGYGCQIGLILAHDDQQSQ